MEKIEIPRFLLGYFDSTTIRTPLSAIMGYSRVMLKGVDGPITERQKENLEIIHNNAHRLFQHWSFAIRAIRYIAHEPEANLCQIGLDDLIKQCTELVSYYSNSLVEVQTPQESLPVWTDLLHTESVFDCIGRLTGDVYHRTSGKLTVKILQSIEATIFEFGLDKTDFTKDENFNLFIEPYLFVIQSVMKLHNGKYNIADTPNEKMLISLVFPYMDQPKQNL